MKENTSLVGGSFMDKYEFGEHLDFDKVLDNKEYYADLFSEGNKKLRKILMHCFNNKIETYMCCTGHVEEYSPFIMFYIPYSNKKLIYSIVSSVYDVDGVTIILGKDHAKEGIQVDIRSYYGNWFFEDVYKGLTDLNNSLRATPDIKNIIEIVNKFDKPSCDLIFRRTKQFDYTDHYSMSVDYIDSDKVKHLYILKEELDYEQVIDLKSPVDDKILNQEVANIKENYFHK